MTPHKHAAIIKAWADGATVEGRPAGGPEWGSSKTPMWYEHWEYRVKPQIARIRLWLGASGNVHAYNETQKFIPVGQATFVKWLGDWQEIEV